MWNDQGYQQPAGCPSTEGYSRDYGYGHEEWNGNPQWNWNGYKVFYTNSTDNLLKAARTGNLGMVMIASHHSTAYALGVATNVYANDDVVEKKSIVNTVGVENESNQVWKLATVQSAFNNKQESFLNHWSKHLDSIPWKCPLDHYYWFPKPVPLNPERITGKKNLSMRHSKFTTVSPEVLLDIIDDDLPKSHTAIRKWLSFGDFVQPEGSNSLSHESGKKKRRRCQNNSSAPTDKRIQYWVEGKRSAEPLHSRLQTKFIYYLKNKGIRPHENCNFIDVQYKLNGKTIFAEIKPTDNVETRYAIRAAIGQLLEYRHFNNKKAQLEIVIGKKPKPSEITFVKSIDIIVTYYDAEQKFFITT